MMRSRGLRWGGSSSLLFGLGLLVSCAGEQRFEDSYGAADSRAADSQTAEPGSGPVEDSEPGGGGQPGETGGAEDSETASCRPDASGTGLPTGSAPRFSVTVSAMTEALPSLSEAGHTHFPDGALSLLPSSSGWEVYLPVAQYTMRLTGASPLGAQPNPQQAVLRPSEDPSQPDQGYAGGSSFFDCGGERVAVFHSEYHLLGLEQPADSPPPYHATMGSARSADGLQFQRDTPPWVLTSAGQAEYRDGKIAYGAGGGSVFDPGGDYLYLYYYDWDDEQGLHLARSCRRDCAAPGSWRKWDGGGFRSDALGADFLSPSGPSEPVLPAGSGSFDAFTVVSQSDYLGGYLMVSATESGVSLRASRDGLVWGDRVPVLEHISTPDTSMAILYPSVFDAQTWSRDQTGRQLKLFVAAELDASGERASHRAWVMDLELTAEGDSPTVSYGLVTLRRSFQSSPVEDHWVTTSSTPGYQDEGGLGKLAEAPLPETMPLYDCVLSDGNHLVSLYSSCEGGTRLGLMGYLWESASADRHPLYRCWMQRSDGRANHYVSLDAGCEGGQAEGLLGYAD